MYQTGILIMKLSESLKNISMDRSRTRRASILKSEIVTTRPRVLGKIDLIGVV